METQYPHSWYLKSSGCTHPSAPKPGPLALKSYPAGAASPASAPGYVALHRLLLGSFIGYSLALEGRQETRETKEAFVAVSHELIGNWTHVSWRQQGLEVGWGEGAL